MKWKKRGRIHTEEGEQGEAVHSLYYVQRSTKEYKGETDNNSPAGPSEAACIGIHRKDE